MRCEACGRIALEPLVTLSNGDETAWWVCDDCTAAWAETGHKLGEQLRKTRDELLIGALTQACGGRLDA